MKVNFETAEKVWKAYFGDVSIARDAFGIEIRRNEHGTGSAFSWEVDHIWPQNPQTGASGANIFKNVQPLSSTSNLQKSNDLQGKVNGITFAIHKEGTHDGLNVGRMAVKKNEEWFWAYHEPKY